MLEDILSSTLWHYALSRAGYAGSSAFAGFSLGKADILRRAMGKNAAEMHRMEESFIQGALERAWTKTGSRSFCCNGKICRLWF